ncbi:hypothetical protein L0F63_002878, partial [Massospora cicadina]
DKAERQEAQKVKLQALPDLKNTLDQRWVQAKHAQVDYGNLNNVTISDLHPIPLDSQIERYVEKARVVERLRAANLYNGRACANMAQRNWGQARRSHI